MFKILYNRVDSSKIEWETLRDKILIIRYERNKIMKMNMRIIT
jgi:hypothetical protein